MVQPSRKQERLLFMFLARVLNTDYAADICYVSCPFISHWQSFPVASRWLNVAVNDMKFDSDSSKRALNMLCLYIEHHRSEPLNQENNGNCGMNKFRFGWWHRHLELGVSDSCRCGYSPLEVKWGANTVTHCGLQPSMSASLFLVLSSEKNHPGCPGHHLPQ